MSFDIAIIGAGIAGASLAAKLGDRARIILLEAEDYPGAHSTGRSAAFWHETYGGPDIVPLSRASRGELESRGILAPRGAMHIGRAEDAPLINAYEAQFGGDVGIERVDPRAIIPTLQPDWTFGLWEEACADIDVGALHSQYLSEAAKAGIVLRTRFRVDRLHSGDDGWTIGAGDEQIEARLIVNAAGAWADAAAGMANIAPIGLTPMRRTIMQLRLAQEVAENGPLTLAIDESFYFKPVGDQRIWLSPHDEIPDVAHDVAPEELDIAIAIDRFQNAVDVEIEAVERRWAGLRTFAPDRLPVIGPDPSNERFFWLAGQGGFGIQTAPAAAELAAAMITGSTMPSGLDQARYSADRFYSS